MFCKMVGAFDPKRKGKDLLPLIKILFRPLIKHYVTSQAIFVDKQVTIPLTSKILNLTVVSLL